MNQVPIWVSKKNWGYKSHDSVPLKQCYLMKEHHVLLYCLFKCRTYPICDTRPRRMEHLTATPRRPSRIQNPHIHTSRWFTEVVSLGLPLYRIQAQSIIYTVYRPSRIQNPQIHTSRWFTEVVSLGLPLYSIQDQPFIELTALYDLIDFLYIVLH